MTLKPGAVLPATVTPDTLYAAITAAGIQVDNHESDMYFPATEESAKILARFPMWARNATRFESQTDGAIWYDVPFAFLPFWSVRLGACGSVVSALAVGVLPATGDHGVEQGSAAIARAMVDKAQLGQARLPMPRIPWHSQGCMCGGCMGMGGDR